MALANLKIGFLNVNGFVGQKTYDPEFNEILEKFDILCLTETWHSNEECIKKVKKTYLQTFYIFKTPEKININEANVTQEELLYFIENIYIDISLFKIKTLKTCYGLNSTRYF